MASLTGKFSCPSYLGTFVVLLWQLSSSYLLCFFFPGASNWIVDLFVWFFHSHPFSSVFYVIFVWQLKLLTLLLNYLFQLIVLIYKSISLLSVIPCQIILFIFQTCNNIFFYICLSHGDFFSEVLFYLPNYIYILWVIFLFYLLLVSLFYVRVFDDPWLDVYL